MVRHLWFFSLIILLSCTRQDQQQKNTEVLPADVELLEEQVEQNPDDANAHLKLGSSYLDMAGLEGGKSGFYQKAENVLDRAYEIDSTSPAVVYELGSLYAKTGRPDQAVDKFLEGLSLGQEESKFHSGLGYVLRYAGYMDASVSAYKKAQMTVSNLPSLIQAQDQITKSLIYQRRYEDALESHRHAQAWVAEAGVATNEKQFFYEGVIHIYRGDWNMAGHAFDRSWQTDSTSVWSFFGKTYGQARARSAARMLEQLEQRQIVDGERRYRMVHFYTLMENHDQAMNHLRIAIEAGFFNFPYISTDPLTVPVRAHPSWTEVTSVARAKHEQFAVNLEKIQSR
jgi:tetratricopeptide (TPR) repeat protein